MSNENVPDDRATLRLSQSGRVNRAPRVAPPALEAGLVLAERFTIVRFIARGGMGEVYEAHDIELNENVALKTIRPDIAEDPMALARFKREIQLARKVTHPNVSRIFDIFHHQWPEPERPSDVAERSDDVERLTFLTMELLSGETLHERLEREGRMAPADAIAIIAQVTAALDAAHAAGIVHRDLKSANVMLVPSKSGQDVRAVVTDFGLAYSGGSGGTTMRTALTTYGDTLGTPDYMAPEQVTGGTITEAADIYALGIVMYEMVTGRRPFTSDSPLTTAVKRLSEPPPPPRTHVKDLDQRWEATILRCLERNPADRFSSAGDVLKALAGGEVAAGRRELDERRRRKQRALVIGAGAAALLVVTALGVRYVPSLVRSQASSAGNAGRPAAAAVKARRGVAVIGFKNSSAKPESAWISTALSEMLTTELGAGEQLQTSSSDTVARVKTDLGLSEADAYPKDTLGRIRANLGTDVIVLGSYLASGGRVRLDLRMQDTTSGETIATVGETVGESDLIDLATRAGEQLRAKLGLGALSAADAQSVQAALPANAEAARLYAEGVAKLRVADALGAKGLLERAVIADPKHALAHTALAAAWSAMGYDGNSRAEAKKAFDLSTSASREDRYVVEARYHEAAQEWDQAAATYEKLFGFFPDSLDYGLRLASSQTAAGKGREALGTLDALRKLPAPANDDPRIDLAEANTAAALSDFKRERTAAANAAAKGTKTGARLIVGNARLAEGWALRNLGQLPDAAAALEDAKSIFVTASDRGGVARAVNYQGLLLKDQGYLDQAREMFQQALTIRRAIGDLAGVAATMNNIGTILWQRGQLAEARDMHAQALTTYRQIGNRTGIAQTQQNMGNVSVYQGDLPGARKMYEDALASYRDVGNKSGEADILNNLASLLLNSGDAAGARPLFADALKIQREIGRKTGIGGALTNLGFALLQEGDYAAAAKNFDEAVAVYRDLKDQEGVASALTNSGIGLQQQGRLAEAKKAFDDALAANASRGRTLSAQSRLGQVLMLQGDVPAARKTYEAALAGWQQLGDKFGAAQTQIALAQIAIEEGRPADAETAARTIADQFAAQKRADGEALALDAVARALLAEGKAVEAAKAVARAQSLPAAALATLPRDTRLVFDITGARTAAATGKSADGIRALNATLATATKGLMVWPQFEARLALGEIEMQSGQTAAGVARLQALERDATPKNFGLIARHTAAARRGAK
ncbi:MAG: tetratricopeptide repeat protein [Acidobacteriia bacterium]|nr:tetratricopeptide repeat protein [Terriglobia bacterium]